MTDTLTPPSVARSPSTQPSPVGAHLASGAVAAAGAAVRGLLLLAVPVVLVWWAEDRTGSSSLVDAARATGQLWLVAHGAWLDLPVGRLGLTPLGLTLLPLLLCRRAGRVVGGSRPGRPVLVTGVAVGVPYGLLAAALAAATAGDTLRPMPLVAGGVGLVLAGASAAVGAWQAERGPARAARARPRLHAALLGCVAGLAVLAAAGALLVAGALALDAGTAGVLAESTEPGAVGGLGLALLGVAFAPNAVVWAVSWFAGPGFAVGVGTSVSPLGVELGPVPTLPLLAALPGGGPPSWAVLALAVPVLAGAVAAGVVQRRGGAVPGRQAALDVALSVVLAGALLAVLAAVSGGPLGGEHLSSVGPSAWRVGSLAAVEMALGAGLALLVLRRRSASVR
jgi:hypothetical protein